MQQIRTLGGSVGGITVGGARGGLGMGSSLGNAAQVGSIGQSFIKDMQRPSWSGGGQLFPVRFDAPPLPKTARGGDRELTGYARSKLGPRSDLPDYPGRGGTGSSGVLVADALINFGKPHVPWYKYSGISTLAQATAMQAFERQLGLKMMPTVLRRAGKVGIYFYVANGVVQMMDDIPNAFKDTLLHNTDYDREQAPIKNSLAKMPEAHRAALRDLQYSISAEARKQEQTDYLGFRLNRNGSYFPWNWETEDPVNRKRVTGITEELNLRGQYFQYNRELMTFIGTEAYRAGDQGWEKRVAIDSALAATGRIYKSPHPQYIYARAKAGG